MYQPLCTSLVYIKHFKWYKADIGSTQNKTSSNSGDSLSVTMTTKMSPYDLIGRHEHPVFAGVHAGQEKQLREESDSSTDQKDLVFKNPSDETYCCE